jgi:tight adherence protein B
VPFVIASGVALGALLMFSGLTQGPRRNPRGGARILDRIRRLAAEAGYHRLGGAGLLGLCTACGVLGFVLGAALSSVFLFAVGSGIGGIFFPLARARVRAARRRDVLQHAWPDVLADIISGVRAGRSLAECCTALAHRGPPELQPAFAAFTATYAATASFGAALSRLRDTVEDPIADRVVAVLRIAHEVGGNDLVRVLRTSADLIREDLRIRGEIRARWSWTLTAARVAAGAPFAVLAIMGLRPEAAAAYTSDAGTATIAVGAGASVLGYRLMLRAARLPEQGRIG